MPVLLSSVLLFAQAPSAAQEGVWSSPVSLQDQGDGGSSQASLLDLFFPRVGDSQNWPRPLADPELAGEVTLLVALSSGSADCSAAAPLLAEMQASFRERGLGILGLAFEATGDFERDAAQVSGFAERHDLEFPFFLCGRADTGSATQALGLREPIRAFPAFLLLGRDRILRAVLPWETVSQQQVLRTEQAASRNRQW